MSPSKTSGQLHSTKGNAKETIGSTIGAHGMEHRGREEHAAGKTEYNAARAKGYAEGTKDRAVGAKDSVVGAVSGDKSQQTSG